METQKSKKYKIWKSIMIGPRESEIAGHLCDALNKNCKIKRDTIDAIYGLLLSFAAEERKEVDLTVLFYEELGFKDRTTSVKDIREQGIKWGLYPCSPEIGPQLRLQYMDQPVGESLIVITEPVIVRDGCVLLSFELERNSVGHRLLNICIPVCSRRHHYNHLDNSSGVYHDQSHTDSSLGYVYGPGSRFLFQHCK